MADGSRVLVSEQGDFHLQSEDAQGNAVDPLVLRDVSILKGSPMNLVSVGILCEEGSVFHFEKGKSYFDYKGRRHRLIERDGLYLLRLDEVLQADDIAWLRDCEANLGNSRATEVRSKLGTNYACAASWDLWHERFGHASKKRLKFIFDNGSVEGMSVVGAQYKHDRKCTCPTCLAVNNAKVHIGDVREFADSVTRKGQLVYTDICGPFPASVEGYRYVISFTDVYSRFSSCYMLRKKSDSEAALKAFISFYARNGIVIKEIRSDQGGEFGGANASPSVSGGADAPREDDSLNFFFKRVCDQHKILHVPTPAYRPELHGLAERWNLTVMKMANAMLFSARLSHILWPSAVANANMLRNRLPVRGLGKFTPYELFFGERPRIDQLRVFGCDCYKLLPTYPKIPGQAARKRLIYCGETADRIGYRVFDPVTYKYSTEFELVFDETSARKRINSLYEHDSRRELSKKGKLSSLPLLANDFEQYTASQQAVRDVFSSPSPSSDVLLTGVSSGDLAGSADRSALGDDSAAPRSSTSDQHSPAHLTGATPRELRHIKPGPQGLTTSAPEGGASSYHYPASASLMGDNTAAQKPQSGCKRDTVPILTEESDDDEAPEEFKIHGQSLRPGPLPTLRPRKSQVDLNLSEVDGASVLLNDAEADVFGPLTKEALEAERKRSQLDPRHPCRPLRLLPVGQIEKDTPEFKAFRKHALDSNVAIKLVDNPKIPGKESHRRYERYQPATTLRELIELSVSSSNPAVRAQQIKKAHEDIVNDSLRGYIVYPQFEHPASAHFVHAERLARRLGTVNIHCLYSSEEITSARAAALLAEAEQEAAYVAFARQREATSVPLRFHDQVKALWEYDLALQLNESDLKKESAYAAAIIDDIITGGIPEPKNFRSVARHPEREEWLLSMGRERATLEERGTWELVPRSSIGRHRPVKCKYVFRKKMLKDKSIQFKSRLVACGYSQVAGLDYSLDELYAGVCSYSSMRFLMSIACQKGYILSQTDITGAYLESHLSEEIYMEPPPDMRGPSGEPPRDAQGRELVCKLKRGLYGLKQSGYHWQQCLHEFLLRDPKYNMGFTQFTGEPNMFRKVFELNGRTEDILLGVLVTSNEEARLWFMSRLEERFPVNPKSSGVITWESPGLVLSMHVRYDHDRGILQFDQRASIQALAAKYGVMDLPPKSMPITPAVILPKLAAAEVEPNEYLSIVGSCLHIAQVSRPDIAYAVGVLSRHSATPGRQHMEAAINLVNYLFNTQDMYIQYKRSTNGNNPQVYEKDWSPRKSMEERLRASQPDGVPMSADVYVDADYAGDINTRRSTSGMVTMMNNGPISWSSRLQKLCAQSSAESEIYAVTDSAKEACHIKLLCEEAGIREPGRPLTIWEDNVACIHLGHGLLGSKAAKHFAVRLRALNELIHDNTIEFSKVDTKHQLGDGFTKALPGPAFFAFRDLVLHHP